MHERTDAELITASVGQPECFQAVFDRHFSVIHRYLRRRVGAELAAELTSETFLAAFRSRERYIPGQVSALPWLYGIASNLLRMHQRGEERRLRAYARAARESERAAPPVAVDERLDAAAMRPALAAALADLTPALREVLLLHAWSELSHAEIAEALGCSAGVVRARLHRARLHRARVQLSEQLNLDQEAVAP
jgi:RNA polymerase sigma-70 factor (ECF subfamily)